VGDLYDELAGDDLVMPPAARLDDRLAVFELPSAQRIPLALRHLDAELAACFSPVADHVSAGFQLHSCTSLDEDHPGSQTSPITYELSQQEPPVPTVAKQGDRIWGVSPLRVRSPLLIASIPQEGSSRLASQGVQLVIFRAFWGAYDADFPSWEMCMLGGWDDALLHATFYKHDHLALVLRASAQSGTTFALRSLAGIEFVPLCGAKFTDDVGAAPSLLTRLERMLHDGGVYVQPLGVESGECAFRSRTFGRTEAQQIALSHTRGMASIVTKARRVLLLDLEEDAAGEEEMVEEDESELGGSSVADDLGTRSDTNGDDMVDD